MLCADFEASKNFKTRPANPKLLFSTASFILSRSQLTRSNYSKEKRLCGLKQFIQGGKLSGGLHMSSLFTFQNRKLSRLTPSSASSHNKLPRNGLESKIFYDYLFAPQSGKLFFLLKLFSRQLWLWWIIALCSFCQTVLERNLAKPEEKRLSDVRRGGSNNKVCG